MIRADSHDPLLQPIMALALKPADAAWLHIENEVQPCHIASLSVFSRPPGAPADYVSRTARRRSTRRDT